MLILVSKYSKVSQISNHFIHNCDTRFLTEQWIKQQYAVFRQWAKSKEAVSCMEDFTVILIGIVNELKVHDYHFQNEASYPGD